MDGNDVHFSKISLVKQYFKKSNLRSVNRDENLIKLFIGNTWKQNVF